MRENTVQIDQTGRVGHRQARRDQLKQVNGVLVFKGSDPLEIGEDLVSQAREERIQSLADSFVRKRNVVT